MGDGLADDRNGGDAGFAGRYARSAMFTVSEIVRTKAAVLGAEDWVHQLPVLVSSLAAEWGFTPIRPLDGGTESFLLEVRQPSGTLAVLKLLIPRDADSARHEISVLKLAGGHGCPRLLNHDADRGAMLMERLGRSLCELGMPMRARHRIMCTAAARLWRPAPGSGLPTAAEKGRWLIGFITATWEALDRPLQELTIDHAIACAERRIGAYDEERARLVHGDVHQWNTLEAGDGFALIDPDGLLAEPEYDLGIIMREDPVDLLAEGPWSRAHRLARLTRLDPTAIWEWGVVERVSTGLLLTQIGLQPVGHEMLTTADVVARL